VARKFLLALPDLPEILLIHIGFTEVSAWSKWGGVSKFFIGFIDFIVGNNLALLYFNSIGNAGVFYKEFVLNN
jgi:hypothetical protein